MKINNFRGDLTDISAKKEALVFVVADILIRLTLKLCSLTRENYVSTVKMHNFRVDLTGVLARENTPLFPALLPIMPKYCLGHPVNYLFVSSDNVCTGSKYPKQL